MSKSFHVLCEETLSDLFEKIETFDDGSVFDVEYSDGILDIEILSNGQKYVINRNSGNEKIWYSSPLTGADYFAFNVKENKWLDDEGEELEVKLFNELKKIK